MVRQILSKHSHHLLSLSILCSIPLALTALHTLFPSKIQQQLVFHYSDPNILTAWTSAFFHSSTNHLQSNLLGYGLAVIPSYFLYDYWDRRYLFWVIVVLLFVVTPFVTTLTDYFIGYLHWGIFTDEISSRGFSGIVSAFGGMLLGGVTLFSAAEYGQFKALNVALTAILVGVAILSYMSGILSPKIGGLLVIGILGTLSSFVTLEDVRDTGRLLRKIQADRDDLSYIVYCGFVVGVIIAIMFPLDVVQDGMFVNIISHGSGFVFGVLVTLGVGRLA